MNAETRNGGGDTNPKSPRAPSPPLLASSSDGSKVNSRTGTLSRRTFTRSRSPAPRSLGLNGIMPQPGPPSPTSFLRTRSVGPVSFVLLPGTLSIKLSSWMSPWEYKLRIDAKLAAEGAILMLALACAAQKLQSFSSALPSDDGLPIGTLASRCSALHADHVHRALRRHLCLLYLPGLESLFLYTNFPVFQLDRFGTARPTPNSSPARVTDAPSWHHNFQPTHSRKPGICMDDRT
jgi:hypothetical protein